MLDRLTSAQTRGKKTRVKEIAAVAPGAAEYGWQCQPFRVPTQRTPPASVPMSIGSAAVVALPAR